MVSEIHNAPSAVIDQTSIASTESVAAPADTRSGWWAKNGMDSERLLSWLNLSAPYLTVAYFAGVWLMLMRLALALRGGRQLSRAALPIEQGSVLAMVKQQAQRMGVRVAPAIAYCEQISVPIVVGIVRPMILLPAALASGLAPDQLQALVTHELAHIRRFDLIVNLLQRVAESLLFFHPAVWFISGRISTERENVADDMVLATGFQPIHYADSLVRMAELSNALRKSPVIERGAVLAASGAKPSEFKRRILRLIGGYAQPKLRLTRLGFSIFIAVLTLVAFSPLLVQLRAKQDRDAAASANNSSSPPDVSSTAKTQKPDTQDSKKPVVIKRPDTPRIVIAEHVLLWGGKEIVTWDEIVRRLRERRKGGPFRAHFLSTNGLHRKGKDNWQDYHDRVRKLYKELFEPVGVSFGSPSPRASSRYDSIRTAADLRPDPKLAREGRVLTPDGRPATGAQVIVLPTGGQLSTLDVALSGAKLRDPLDEQWSPSDATGKFVMHSAADEYLLAILHPSGTAYLHSHEKYDNIKLQPWATLTFSTDVEVIDQHASVSIKPPGAEADNFRFIIHTIKPKDKPITVKVPAGEINVRRSLEMDQGNIISLPWQMFALKSGERRKIKIDPPSIADRKKAEKFNH